MNELDWTEKLDQLSKEELSRLLIITVGMLSTYPRWEDKTPGDIFMHLFEIAGI